MFFGAQAVAANSQGQGKPAAEGKPAAKGASPGNSKPPASDKQTPGSAATPVPNGVERPTGLNRVMPVASAIIIVLAMISSIVTFAIFTGLTPVKPARWVITAAVTVNFVMVAILIAFILREIFRLWSARARGKAGSRLHVRIVTLFSVVAAVPAILVAVVAAVTLDQGLDRWFSDRTRAIVQTSISVAQSYLREHGQVIRADLLAMANDFDRTRQILVIDDRRMQDFLNAQANVRAVPAAYLLRADRTVVFKAQGRGEREFLLPPANAVAQAADGTPIVIAPGETDQVGAVIKLKNYDDLYLYIARTVDQQVVSYLRDTQANFSEFQRLEQERYGVQLAFALIYVGFALLLMLSAILLGIRFADRLVAPIRSLISAADRVAQGKFDVTVPISEKAGDLDMLTTTFNTMTAEVRSQRNELLRANTTLDGRRRFMEAVLAGVTAGVIGVGRDGRITVINRSAITLLGRGRFVGQPITDVLPEISRIIAHAEAQPRRIVRSEITLNRDDKERTIAVRVASEQADPNDHSLVVTLDDITDLVSAQRSAAWADVARRIAHEIKNPLTPIQLSAERLRRKYGHTVGRDREIFDQCIETIVRQVGDIGRMVDEFSSFARMPKPIFFDEDIADVVRQSAFLMRVGNPGIEIVVTGTDEPLICRFDRRLISQGLTNVIKNATEAVSAIDNEARGGEGGRIEVSLQAGGAWVDILVTDNGVGLPAENRERLLEPYMTTREKGTGLGLAIVSRIMEEHGGNVTLGDAPAVARGGRGAQVRMRLKRELQDEDTADITPRRTADPAKDRPIPTASSAAE